MNQPTTDIAIIGAGPYGLSIAAHLRKRNINFRIFGAPMQSWREQMPKGMFLKSDGFASSLYDPDSAFTLRHYCAEHDIPYGDVGVPVRSEVFVSYGLEFQKRFVPNLESTNITSVKQVPQGFQLETATGDILLARKVVVAAGIAHFGYLPPFLANLPKEFVSHSFGQHDLSHFKGKKVVVIGAGASAVDIAALLNDVGADTHLVARRAAIAFHAPSKEPRPLFDRITNPRSGLGLGWRSRLCTDAPLLFYQLPYKLRARVVRRHLGPAPGWFVRDMVVGRFPQHMGSTIKEAVIENGQVKLSFTDSEGQPQTLFADHVIGATGFQATLDRLKFLDPGMRDQMKTIEGTPVLSRSFESSVPGLYIVGVASANFFGPLTRFAFGAGFTAKRISRHLSRALGSRRAVPVVEPSSAQPAGIRAGSI